MTPLELFGPSLIVIAVLGAAGWLLERRTRASPNRRHTAWWESPCAMCERNVEFRPLVPGHLVFCRDGCQEDYYDVFGVKPFSIEAGKVP